MSDPDYPKGKNPTRPAYQRKGWKGLVDGKMKENYCEHYDNMEWGRGTKRPELIIHEGIKTTYIYK